MKKKKSILAVLAFVGLTAGLMAQVNMGIKAGYQRADISVPQISSISPVTPKGINGFSVGIFAEVPMTENVFFQPELNLVRKGFQIHEGTDVNILGIPVPVGARAITQLNYIEMPVLLKAKTSSAPVQAFVAAGPTFGYAVSGKLKTRVTALFDFNVYETDINLNSNIYNRFEVGGVIAGGLQFNTAMGQITVEGRYNQGFTDMLDDQLLDLRMKNRGFGLHVGVAKTF